MPRVAFLINPTTPQGEWNSSLFGCFSMKGCGPVPCLSLTLCLPCTYGSALHEAGLCSAATGTATAIVMPCCSAMWNRRAAVAQLGVDESFPASCAAAFLCCPCSACQAINEGCVHAQKVVGCAALAPEPLEVHRLS